MGYHNPLTPRTNLSADGSFEHRCWISKGEGGLAAYQCDKKAKPTPYQPPVFKEPGGKLVVAVQSPEEIPSARQVAAEVEATAVVVREVARSCNLQPHSTARDRSQSRA